MRNKLRSYYLAFVRDWHVYWSHCYYCGQRGASVCSVFYPKRLCDACATAACRTFDLFLEAKKATRTWEELRKPNEKED
jgi:hypothetical protein